ncbi:hypothetical protein ACH5RR_018184 [Cinchona calisaya]|uniref:O-fucosyltransferase family protein n=1 Tax=Cinchona calisaya TaxID=153742 RepID=A0ABD2ZPC8_9GENT
MPEETNTGYRLEQKNSIKMYDRLLNLASSSLAEICNAVAVASLRNATLVIPKFLYSNLNCCQFGDIYQDDYFINMMENEVDIVKELPPELKLLDLEAIGSKVTDADLSKEATPDEYINKILPLILQNGVVHFLGFGNRLGFDPLPVELHQAGSLLIRRIRKYDVSRSILDKQLVGNFISDASSEGRHTLEDPSRRPSPEELRNLGRCPLTPEEVGLVLAALGFKSDAYIYLAGSEIYGGETRMHPLPASTQMWSQRNIFSHQVNLHHLRTSHLRIMYLCAMQLAALDFIACATADVFAITDREPAIIPGVWFLNILWWWACSNS